MDEEIRMTIDERRKYLQIMQQRYRKADRKERGMLLDEMEKLLGLHRKSLIRLMNSSLARRRRSRERGRHYGPEVDRALSLIAESYDDICAERLQPHLVTMAQHLARHGELGLSEELVRQLAHISLSTLRRRLARLRQGERLRGRRKPPAPPNPILRQVPTGRIPWDTTQPGHLEVDLVHHCGPTASGLYVCTLTLVDVATGWTECTPVLGRGYIVMRDALEYVLHQLPFPVLELHPDNDSAFFNQHLWRFHQQYLPDVHISRSRPYHKNDNPFVEQGNASQVRAYLGHERFDTVAQTWVLHHLYARLRIYQNLFLPHMRVHAKHWVAAPQGGTRLRRQYLAARTPFERLCAANVLPPETRARLEALYTATNPRRLREEIYEYIDYLCALPNAAPGEPQDVYLTLRNPALRRRFAPETPTPDAYLP